MSGASSWVRVPRVPWCFAMSRGSSPAITEGKRCRVRRLRRRRRDRLREHVGQRRIPTRIVPVLTPRRFWPWKEVQ